MQVRLRIFAAVFAVLSSRPAADAASCSWPMTRTPTPSGGRCAYWNASDKIGWCEAAEACWRMGGELAIDLELLRVVVGSVAGGGLWIGATDLLVERGANRTGWLLTDGRQLLADNSDWVGGGPGNSNSRDDFLALKRRGINDFKPDRQKGFLCQALVTPNSGRFRRASFLRLGNISLSYCFTELAGVRRESECALQCADRWQCRAALHNKADGRCRMLDFSDASVGDAIETDPDWSKLVKVY